MYFEGNLRNVNRPTIISDPDFQPAEALVLRPDEVHLFHVNLAAVGDAELRWLEILSPDERTRAARFHFARDRRRFAATRALLRILLGSYVGSPPEKLVFSYSTNGKPYFSGENSSVEFNVSHSGDVALLAFARGRALGVDVEHIRENLDPSAIARRYFSANEQSQLAALDPAERCAGFFRCWTRKEAYIKACGDGLSLPLGSFDVSLAPGDQNALLACRNEGADTTMWLLQDLPVAADYAAALCVQGQGWRLIW